MTRFEYDAAASAAWHMDVVHDVPEDVPVPVARWVESQRGCETTEAIADHFHVRYRGSAPSGRADRIRPRERRGLVADRRRNT